MPTVIHHMRKVWSILLPISLLVPMPSAFAIGTTTPPVVLPDSPLIITAYSFDDIDPTTKTNNRVNYFELYNTSNELVRARDWSLKITWKLESSPPVGAVLQTPISLALASGDEYIPPRSYIVVSFGGAVSGPTVNIPTGLVGGSGNYVNDIALSANGFLPYQKSFSSPQTTPMRLKQTTTGYTSTGTYASEDRSSLYDNGWYEIGVTAPASFPFGPVEILAHPRACGPLEIDASCGDYVKFYNPTSSPIAFDGTRLRVGYQGQSVTTANTISLSGTIQSGEYVLFATTANGSPLSVTNSGGYVWLEDTYGLKVYTNTVVEYEDASSTTHQGESWAQINGVWGWATPSPSGANMPLPAEVEPAATTTSTLKACDAGQYRNPATNRCKSLTASTTSLKACAVNQYRNAQTNRCKAIATTTSLKACEVGQMRNPLTNRCKKTAPTTLPAADFPVKEISSSKASPLGWVAFAGVGSAAIGYGVWEWRRELSSGYRSVLKWLKP